MTGTEQLQEFTIEIADAIREKTGTTESISPQDFAARISSISGTSNGANVQAVDTGDVLDDVTVEYTTQTYVDGLVGDINSVLESIIGGSSSGGSSSGGSGAYAYVNHGTSDTTFELTPNTFHVWDEVTSLNITLGAETSGIANEYLFQFISGSTPATLTLPSDIKFSEDLVIEANKVYQISILKGLGGVLSWKVEPSIVFPITLEMGSNGDIGISLYYYLQSIYGEPTSGTILNEEIINNYNGLTFETVEYGTYMGFTGYWLNGYSSSRISWVLLEDGYLQRVIPAQEN